MIKSNLHTHSIYCDGKNSIEEMISRALSLGFTSLGFSSHAYTGLKEDSSQMSLEGTKKYFNEIDEMKEKYKGAINIFKGLEQEAAYPFKADLDYAIYSCHFLNTDKGILTIDFKAEYLKELLEALGGKDNFFKSYYNTLLDNSDKVDFQIVGHLDIYTKFDEKYHIIEEVPSIALEAVEELNRKGKIFEINTGAIGRGYRTSFYPSDKILNHLKAIGANIIVTSDCHNADYLDCFFAETREILLNKGFKTQMELTPNGFQEVAL